MRYPRQAEACVDEITRLYQEREQEREAKRASLSPRRARTISVVSLEQFGPSSKYQGRPAAADIAFSRRVLGWSLGEGLDAGLPIAALRRAIDLRQPAPELVHHSDRGVQYASNSYVDLLAEHGLVPSMSRAGNPYDNAKCESLMKTLKQEEIHTRKYRDRADLEAHIGEFFDRYYNRRRLHSALGPGSGSPPLPLKLPPTLKRVST